MYEYRPLEIVVVDGDTFHTTLDLGVDVAVKLTVRLYGINAPEMSTPAGHVAKDFVVAWLAKATAKGPLTVHTIKDKREKYGRYLAHLVAADGSDLATDLLVSGNAVPYFP